jgi:hypothetical protein
MPKKYRCQLYMGHAESFAQHLIETEYKAIGEELIERLYKDQHELFHDGEFFDGCTICDEEKVKYG